jgi:hypothetical protein
MDEALGCSVRNLSTEILRCFTIEDQIGRMSPCRIVDNGHTPHIDAASGSRCMSADELCELDQLRIDHPSERLALAGRSIRNIASSIAPPAAPRTWVAAAPISPVAWMTPVPLRTKQAEKLRADVDGFLAAVRAA